MSILPCANVGKVFQTNLHVCMFYYRPSTFCLGPNLGGVPPRGEMVHVAGNTHPPGYVTKGGRVTLRFIAN